MATVRDKLWIFGVRAHQDDIYLCRARQRRHPLNWSRITQAEGAMLLDVPNVAMVNCDGVPAPFSHDAYGYAESFRRLDRVLWGCAGSGGFRSGNEEKFIRALVEKYPNICGAYLDDYIGAAPEEAAETALRSIRAELSAVGKPLEIYVTWYFGAKASARLFEYIDGVTIWTWNWQGLKDLPENFAQLERDLPGKKKILGCYLFDFDSGESVPVEWMEYQCEFGLKMLREGRLDGIMFEANSVMGVGLESEKWLCSWIDRVKHEELPA